jgi:hypothetical protein
MEIRAYFLSQDEAFSTLLKAGGDDAPAQREDLWLARGLI